MPQSKIFDEAMRALDEDPRSEYNGYVSKELTMTTQTVQIELPVSLLERARVHVVDSARDLITFLLEK